MSELSRKRTPVPLDYRIEFSAHSWAELGTVPAHVFKRIRGQLETLALSVTSPSSESGRGGAASELTRFEVDGFVSTCKLDRDRRAVVLVSVTPKDAD